MKHRKIWFWVFLIILVGIFVLLNSPRLKQNDIINPSSVENQKLSSREIVKVLRVVDGDTIKVLINDTQDTVRLIGIDAPETVDPKKPVQCFGEEASAKAKEVLEDKEVVLESDPTQGNRDEYGRLLRYVFLEDGTNFDGFMIFGGYAREYTFKGNPYKYQMEFVQDQNKAKGENRGLWDSCQRSD